MSQEVWMKRNKIICKECECWEEMPTAPNEGTCKRNPPVPVGTFDKATWPVTVRNSGCWEGIQKTTSTKAMLNEAGTGQEEE